MPKLLQVRTLLYEGQWGEHRLILKNYWQIYTEDDIK